MSDEKCAVGANARKQVDGFRSDQAPVPPRTLIVRNSARNVVSQNYFFLTDGLKAGNWVKRESLEVWVSKELFWS